MAFNFARKRSKSPAVGLDFNATNVKLVELSQQGDKYRLDKFSLVPLAPNTIVENEIKDHQGLATAIRKACSKARTKTNLVSLAVPGSSVVIKETVLEANLSGEEMAAQAWVEVNEQFHDVIDDVSLDFQVLKANKDDDKLSDVILVACRKENVQSRVNVLLMAGLNAQVVDVDYFAFERASSLLGNKAKAEENNNKLTTLINISGLAMSLIVMRNGEMIYYRDQPFNSNVLQEGIKQQLEVDAWFTGLLEKMATLSSEEKDKLAHLVVPSFVTQIRQILQFFYSASDQNEVDEIILSGELAVVPHIQALLQEQLGIAIDIANPFANVEFADGIDQNLLQAAAPACMLSMGLALRGLI